MTSRADRRSSACATPARPGRWRSPRTGPCPAGPDRPGRAVTQLQRVFPRGRHRLVSSRETHLTCCHLSPHLGGSSAMLMNHRYDILAWNPEMARLLLDFDTLPPARRNSMWLCLMHPRIREFYVDRERVVREGIAHLRAAWAAHPEDKALIDLITELTAHDEEFARLWAERDVKVNGRGRKVIRHPDVGVLALRFEVLMPLEDPDQRLLIYRAADDESQSAMDRLCAR
ncbi:hypothetical protein AB0D24_42615 [Streptomyces javensis]|uniref:MmyB family transcriptional regulator n=1 Tax=Streptomyces javensis TaxID=114698 RepID=UPI0033E9E70E